jgi:hypothetical protein
MKNIKYLLITFFLYSTVVFADEPNPDDDPVIGKTLWVNYENNICTENFKIYKNKLTGDQFPFNNSVEIEVKSLEKTPFNWNAGAWYLVTIHNENSKGYISYNSMHASYGYIKNLYLAEGEHVDLTLLKDACVTNISPDKKSNVIEADKKLALEREKLLIEETQRKDKLIVEENKRAEAAAIEAVLADNIRKEKLAAEQIQKEKDQRALILKNAPEEIKTVSTSQFCEYYGFMLRNEYVTSFGSAADMRNIIKKEASRRNLKVNANIVKKRHIKLNISTCDLYASWGTPDDENKSVGSFGVHIQHIYRRFGTYVYSQNGRITSWQE